MFPSIKHRKFIVHTLVGSLVVAGLIQSVTHQSDASYDATPAQLTPTVKESKERAVPEASAVDEATKTRISTAYNKLPLRFEENRGQVDKQVKFISRGSDSTLFLTPTEAVLTLRRSEKKQVTTKDEALLDRRSAIPARPQPSSMNVVRMKLHGANRSPLISGESEMSVRTNYFTGNDPQQWQTEVAQYERVRYAQVYPGIDVIYYGQEQRLEYDFEVEPGADPQRIVLGFKGAKKLSIEAATGDLLLKMAGGELRQQKPVTYQEINGERREVESRYVKRGKRKVGIKVGEYDRTQPLVIDPIITYSTYLGGSLEEDVVMFGGHNGAYIAVDTLGNAYITGVTLSTNFPTLNAYQPTTVPTSSDAFVTKLNPNLSGAASLLYSTYLGGNLNDLALSIAVDVSGNVYVAGFTNSTNFPVLNAYQPIFGGESDAFVTKLNPHLSGAASLLYSTFLGGNTFEGRNTTIAVDASGNAYVTGTTASTNFPTLNAYQSTTQGSDAFVTKLNPNLSGAASLLYSTYLGGSDLDMGRGIAVDASGNVYVTGWTVSTNFPTLNAYQPIYQGFGDAFVAKLNPNLSGAASLLYSTYLGGNVQENEFGSLFSYAGGIAVDAAGNAYVTGYTASINFPTLNAYQSTYQGGGDAFVAKLNPNLSGVASLLYSTYLGGSGGDAGFGIAVDAVGNVYVTGVTASTNFPTRHPYQPTLQGSGDAFVAKLNPKLSGNASLFHSTYLGGNASEIGWGIRVNKISDVYVTGATLSTNFPTLNQYQADQGGTDAFVTKLRFCAPSFGDFDIDQRTDFAFWRPSDGNWRVMSSVNGGMKEQHWGQNGDKPVPGDYDGDGKTDFAVFRPSENTWYIIRSSDNEISVQAWGLYGDIPVAHDYDGDGKTDLAVFRPLDSTWHVLYSSDSSSMSTQFGMAGDKPVPADYDGDGKADLAVFRTVKDTRDVFWYILNSFDHSIRVEQWGRKGDRAVSADYDGDCRADIAVWRPDDRVWYILKSSDATSDAVQWGLGDDIPVPGDYDGDGKADVAVWRTTPAGIWYVLQSSDGMLNQQEFGSSGEVPVPSAYLPESD